MTGTLQPDAAPVPVAIVTPDPVPVTVMGETSAGNKTEAVQHQATDPSKAATTTFQQDLIAAGQRTVNLTWENTQKDLALRTVGTALVVAAALAILGKIIGSPELQLASVVFIYGVANLIVGFYFGRTNHTKTGGVGSGEIGR